MPPLKDLIKLKQVTILINQYLTTQRIDESETGYHSN